MNYLKLLEHSYAMAAGDECPPDSRLEFLGEQIFDFTTYDGEMSALFAGKAIEVCDAINNGATFEYIKDPENYRWFLLMCNMPFFAGRLSWGSSIRGAWWDTNKLESCGLYEGEEQVLALHFTRDEWAEFARALVVFARSEVTPADKLEALEAEGRERAANITKPYGFVTCFNLGRSSGLDHCADELAAIRAELGEAVQDAPSAEVNYDGVADALSLLEQHT